MSRIWEAEIAALDFETTGLSTEVDRVIEVAVVRGRLGETPRAWSALVHPQRAVSATWVHGIDDAMVANKPIFSAIADDLLRWLDGAVVLAHNSSFDVGFLAAELTRLGRSAPILQVIDTLAIARRNYRFPSNSLDSLCTRFAVQRARAHRAADDAAATFTLCQRMLHDLDPGHQMSVDEVLQLRRPEDHVARVHAALKEALKKQATIEIEYDAQSQRTRRRITIVALERNRVRAFCHLREADREFSLERIRWVGEIIG